MNIVEQIPCVLVNKGSEAKSLGKEIDNEDGENVGEPIGVFLGYFAVCTQSRMALGIA